MTADEPMSTPWTESHHGSNERVGWSIEVSDDTLGHRNGSVTTYGANEQRAREDYAKRLRAMRRGRTIRLVRRVTVEAWVMHAEAVEAVSKPAPIDGGTR